MAKTYNTLYMDLRSALRKAGVEEAQLEARELICHVTGKSREEFFRSMQLYVVSETEEEVNAVARRRLAGEPLPYILGQWEFYGMELKVDRNVLIPRPDTEIIAQRAIEIARGSGEHCRVLDLCCGTGCIGLAVAKHAPNCRVVLADVSEEALGVARKNVTLNQLGRQITTFRADALRQPPEMIWDFNLIVCNPPYIRSGDMEKLSVSVRDYEPSIALDGGEDGLEFYRKVAENWRSAMRSTCILLFEVGDNQADDVEEILAQNGYRSIRRHKDAFGHWRGVEGSVM
jgi:release factor glutamine methyltransferase